jgi:hypothetical protein
LFLFPFRCGSWYALDPCFFFFFPWLILCFLWFEAHYQESSEPRKDCFRFMYERFIFFFFFFPVWLVPMVFLGLGLGF